MMIRIKSQEILRGLMLHKYPPILVTVLLDVLFILDSWGINRVITSAYRAGDRGVHGVCRGIDLRSHQMELEQVMDLCRMINKKWVYDPSRSWKEVLIFHDVGRGPHLHIQVHPKTTQKEKEE